MAYLVNKTRTVSLTINGVDYLDSLIELTVSDESANKQGLISTTGNLILRTYGTNPLIEDYDRNNFKRGHVVTFDVSIDGGAPVRHPRGYLYVLSTAYNADQDELSVELGCKIALAVLTDNAEALLPLVPIPLDPAQRTVSNVGASFASAGMYCFQNNQGNLQTGYFFENDNTSGIGQGEWTSIYGVTCLESSSLAGSAPIPDRIDLSYQVPSEGLIDNQYGRIDISETTSYYYTPYPAITFIRVKPEGEDPNPTPTPPIPTPTPPPPSTGCGTSPSYPSNNNPIIIIINGGGEEQSCSEGYETVQTSVYIGCSRTERSETHYSGIGGQVSSQKTESYGPFFEANSQYFSDRYTFCRYKYAAACFPNGACPYEGTNQVLLSRQETTYRYGSGGQVIETIQDTFETRLSAAIAEDWRSGVQGAEQYEFRDVLGGSSLYRSSRVHTKYRYSKNRNEQETTTWTSVASRGVGVNSSSNLDALQGIKTVEKRVSSTISSSSLSPDIVNSVTTNTTEKTTQVLLNTNSYITPPTEAGPYIIKEGVPVPILSEDPSFISSVVSGYSNYLQKFIKGDAFGLSLVESLRGDIISNWRPGKPFRYYDPRNGKVIAMRMDACTWGLGANEAIVATNGIWLGFSNGTVSIPNNLIGNSRPDMGSGGLPPTPPDGPPTVDGETEVDQGSFAWVVEVAIATGVSIDMYGENGVKPVMPTDLNFLVPFTFTTWVTGFVATPGSLISAEGDGSLPLESNGSLITVDGVLVDDDLFTP